MIEQQPTETPDSEAGPATTEHAGPDQQTEAHEQPPAESPEPEKKARPEKKAKKKAKAGRPGMKPAQVASYFEACPRCSFFLAGYRLVCQDFDEAVADAAGGWLDLSWNLAVRNLLAKNYGYELAEPLDAFQGVCPACIRAFAFQAGDEEEDDRFSVQINPRA